ncbi:hypothetical protein R84B8_00165 [Treponema sp. R8-4-B8]
MITSKDTDMVGKSSEKIIKDNPFVTIEELSVLLNKTTVENIKNGISILRNPILLSTVQYILPYKGLGTGITRSFSLYPDITMENKIDENQFKVIIYHPK